MSLEESVSAQALSLDSRPSLDYHSVVSNYYGVQLKTTHDLKTGACTAEPPPEYVRELIRLVPQAVLEKFYGCGNPVPLGVEGLSVLDLGSGSGRDCYLAAALVGPGGRVVGVDFLASMNSIAEGNLNAFLDKAGPSACCDVRFLLGNLEDLQAAGVAPGSVDVVISNCVVNLCPEKLPVLCAAYGALKEGGEMFFSDMYADRRVWDSARNDAELVGEGLGGSCYVPDFVRNCRLAGFPDPRLVKASAIAVQESVVPRLGGARYASATFRLFKLAPGVLEEGREDYGETATYLGRMPRSEDCYVFDRDFAFTKGQAVRVDGNLAAILRHSWLAKHFQVSPKGAHQGPFVLEGVQRTVPWQGVFESIPSCAKFVFKPCCKGPPCGAN